MLQKPNKNMTKILKEKAFESSFQPDELTQAQTHYVFININLSIYLSISK